jgi:catalase
VIDQVLFPSFCFYFGLCSTAGAPNYFPNSFSGPLDQAQQIEKSFEVSGKCERYSTRDDDNFTQAGEFWRKVLKPEERERLANNIAEHLRDAAEFIRCRAIDNFLKVSLIATHSAIAFRLKNWTFRLISTLANVSKTKFKARR